MLHKGIKHPGRHKDTDPDLLVSQEGRKFHSTVPASLQGAGL